MPAPRGASPRDPEPDPLLRPRAFRATVVCRDSVRAVRDAVLGRFPQSELLELGKLRLQPIPHPDDHVLRGRIVEEVVQGVVVALVEGELPGLLPDLLEVD